MRRSVTAALLLIVLLLGLAFAIVVFGVMPNMQRLTEPPRARPIVLTRTPRPRPTVEAAPAAATATSHAVPVQKAEATPTPAGELGPDERFQAMLEGIEQIDTVRFTTRGEIVVESARGTESIAMWGEGEIDHGNIRQVVEFDMETESGEPMRVESRTFPDASYVYFNGQWVGSRGPAPAPFALFDIPFNLDDPATQVVRLGPDQLENVPVRTYKYQINFPDSQMGGPMGPMAPAPGQMEAIMPLSTRQRAFIWVGEDGRRYRVDYTLIVHMAEQNATTIWRTSTVYYDYGDPTIKVEPPPGVPIE